MPYATECLQREIRTWIFQANPKRYRIGDSLKLEDAEYWNLNQHHARICKDDRVLVWISGEQAGIYAIGKVVTEPAMISDSPKGVTYWNNPEDGKRVKPRVLVEYHVKLCDRPLLKQFLECDEELWNLKIIQCPRGTNFPVTQNEWESIKSWLDLAEIELALT